MKREYPTHPIVAVAAVAVNAKGQFLLVRRGKDPGKGTWGIPGGVVELGERLEDAVKREIMEETGVAVDPLDRITILDRVYPDEEGRIRFHYIIVEYLCRAEDVIPRASDDVDSAVWITLEEAKTFPLMEITREVIQKGIAMLREYNQYPSLT